MKFFGIDRVVWLKHLLAGLVITIATLMYFWPVISNAETGLVDNYDGLFISTVIRTVQDHLMAGEFDELFEGEYFYPHIQVIAYSDGFFTASLLLLPLRLLSSEPVFMVNIALVLTQMMTGMLLYFLLHSVSDDRMLSVLGSLTFIFSIVRLHYLGHLQMFMLGSVVLFVLGLVEYLSTKKRHWLSVMGLAFLLSVGNSFLLGMFCVLVGMGILVLSREMRDLVRRDLVLIGGMVLLAIPLLVWQVRPYLQVSSRFSYVRPITEVIHFSLSPEMLVTKFGSVGLYLLILTAVVLALKYGAIKQLLPSLKKFNLSKTSAFFVLGISSLVLSLGPALHWMRETVKIPYHVPLPYLGLYYLVPGFKGFRTPSRWIVLGMILLLVWAVHILSRLPTQLRWRIGALCVGLTLLTVPKLTIFSVPQLSEASGVYEVLDVQPEGALIELPIYTWGSGELSRREVERMHTQPVHGKPLVNGYSGFHPREFEALVHDIHLSWPGSIVWRQIRDYADVDYAVLHLDELEGMYAANNEDLQLLLDEVDVLYEDEKNVLVKL